MKLSAHKLSDLAELVGGGLEGDGEIVIRGVAGIREAGEGDITFVANPTYEQYVATTGASAIILGRAGTEKIATAAIRVDDPYVAYVKVIEVFAPELSPAYEAGIHESAIVHPDAVLGKDVRIGPYSQVESGARIGDETTILSGVYIGHDAVIGRRCLVYPRVIVRERCCIGDRVILQPGAVIGSDGFGYAFDAGRHRKIPQIGIVVLEDDVEIGANSTVDRATTGETRIGEGTKIDNLVQVGHNVVIGKHTVIAAQTGIAGSTRIGDYCAFAGQVGISGHIEVGSRVTAAARSAIMQSVGAESTVWGVPAFDIDRARRALMQLRQLPEFVKRIRTMEKKIEELEREKNK